MQSLFEDGPAISPSLHRSSLQGSKQRLPQIRLCVRNTFLEVDCAEDGEGNADTPRACSEPCASRCGSPSPSPTPLEFMIGNPLMSSRRDCTEGSMYQGEARQNAQPYPCSQKRVTWSDQSSSMMCRMHQQQSENDHLLGEKSPLLNVWQGSFPQPVKSDYRAYSSEDVEVSTTASFCIGDEASRCHTQHQDTDERTEAEPGKQATSVQHRLELPKCATPVTVNPQKNELSIEPVNAGYASERQGHSKIKTEDDSKSQGNSRKCKHSKSRELAKDLDAMMRQHLKKRFVQEIQK